MPTSNQVELPKLRVKFLKKTTNSTVWTWPERDEIATHSLADVIGSPLSTPKILPDRGLKYQFLKNRDTTM